MILQPQKLSKENPQTYLPQVGMLSVNLGSFYSNGIPNKEMSLAYCKEALIATLPFVEETLPTAQNYINVALQIVKGREEDAEGFLNAIIKESEIE